jgi:hypothetical protein
MEREERSERREEHEEREGKPEPSGEAATPSGGGDRDEDAIREGRDKLDQAGGGH